MSNDIISETTARKLRKYLASRHFFSHGYSFDLDPKRIRNLVKDIRAIFECFKDEINKTIDRI